jgi:dTMP kinase
VTTPTGSAAQPGSTAAQPGSTAAQPGGTAAQPGGTAAQPGGVSSGAAIRGVLRVKAFRRLWYSTALSSLGDWLGLLATTALATSLVHGYQAQNYALGGVLVVKLLPAILLGPVAGVFADRFDRRRTMVISDAIRFGFFITIPIVHSIAWLLVASFLIECVSLFWMPAKDASVPNLVRRDQIEAANQLSLVTTYGITPVLGAALFSVLSLITNVLARHVHFFRAQPVNLALYFNAATFLFGAIVVYFIREISGSRGDVRPEDQPSMLALAREGWSFVRSSRLIGGLIIGLVGAFAAGGAVIGAGKIFVASLGGGNAAYGVLFGSVFVGLGLGMGFGARIARELSRRRLFGLSIVFAAICLILTALMPQVALAMVFVLGVGFGAGVAYLSGTTLIGTDIGNEMRGRIFALLQSLIRVVLILSLAAVPFVVAQVGRRRIALGPLDTTVDGTRFVLIGGGLLALAAGLLAYRKMDDREHLGVWVDVKMSVRNDSSTRRRLRNGSLFVAFEGGEGSGKSTQIALLAERLRVDRRTVTETHEPGATRIGEQIRELVLHHHEPITPRAEALLFAADRAHHVETVIRPALEAGGVVLTDRYIDSSLAYQGAGRDLSVEDVRRLSRWAADELYPDLTVLLDLPADTGLGRVRDRGVEDKVEAESLAFHDRVRRAFRALAEASPRRYLVIDAAQSPDVIAAQVFVRINAMLSPRRGIVRRDHNTAPRTSTGAAERTERVEQVEHKAI